jgi:predicted outer membrane lipoprotein
MHIFAILSVLVALALAFGVIGGMLLAHREHIVQALMGYVASPVQEHKRLEQKRVAPRRALAKPRATVSPLPLAA